MGKQINYYMDYDAFLEVAKCAVSNGCQIIKKEKGKFICSEDIDIITPDVNCYYFYVKEAGKLDEYLKYGYNAFGNMVIEASYSLIYNQKIHRARLFSINGYYDNGNWIGRSDCVKKVYDKLVRMVKKVAPYTEVVDIVNDKEWKRKEYITNSLLSP